MFSCLMVKHFMENAVCLDGWKYETQFSYFLSIISSCVFMNAHQIQKGAEFLYIIYVQM